MHNQSTLIEVAKLQYTVNYPYKRENYDINGLMASIKEQDLKNPIHIATTTTPGSYIILDGNMRVDAIKAIGKTHIMAYIHDIPTEKHMEFLVASNKYRQKTKSELNDEALLLVPPPQQGKGRCEPDIKGKDRYEIGASSVGNGKELSGASLRRYEKGKESDEKYPELKLIDRLNAGQISVSEMEQYGKNYEAGLKYHEANPELKLKEKVLGSLLPVSEMEKYGKDYEAGLKYHFAYPELKLKEKVLSDLLPVGEMEQNGKDYESGLIYDVAHPELKLKENVIKGVMKPSEMVPTGRKCEEYKRLQNENANKSIIPPTEVKNFKMGNISIFEKSAEFMSELKDNSVPLAVLSPYYYNQRQYSKLAKEFGKEKTADIYLSDLMKIMKELYRVNSDAAFVNIDDTYDCYGDNNIPEKFVIEMAKLGYHKKSTIIWRKTNFLTKGNEDKTPLHTWEYLYYFVKDRNNYYYKPIDFFPQSKEIKLKPFGGRRNPDGSVTKPKLALTKPYSRFGDFIDEQDFFSKVVETSTASAYSAFLHKHYQADHPAPYLPTIPLYPILCCSKPGDNVLDPFMGSGTTLATAILLGRKGVGYEILPENFDLSKRVLTDICIQFNPEMANAIENKFEEVIKQNVA